MPRPAILCVDDERTVLVALKEQLRRRFGRTHSIEVAEDGETALEVLAELHEEGVEVPLVVSDHIMPGLKGDEVLARIEATSPETVKIMLTGQATADAVGNALNRANLFRYLSKPWEEADLGMTVRAALDTWQARRDLAEQQETLRQLHHLAVDLTADLGARDRHERVVQRVAAALGTRRTALFQVDGARLRRLAATGDRPDDTPRALRVDPGSSLASALAPGGLVHSGEEVGHASLADDLGWGDLKPHVVAIALEAAGEQVGLLALGSDDPTVLQTSHDPRLRAFAALAAASVRTATLIDALEKGSAQQQQVASALMQQADERSSGPLQGSSPAIRATLRELGAAADSARPLLLTGPLGSGREAAARFVHRSGPRASRPFLAIQGAAVQHARELAPHDVGPAGPFELADGGTLYIAGVDRLARTAQAQLARTLSALGPGVTSRDVRVIASLSGPDHDTGGLEPELAAALRERVVLPAMRDRTEDIPVLAAYYLRAHATRLGRPVDAFEEGVEARLLAYPWPGNVRELDRVVERAVLAAEGPVARVGAQVFDASDRLGSYRLTRRIGAGGMGEVWIAQHDHLPRSTAIKLIHAHRTLTGDRRDEAIERFRREAAATSRLVSPHTVELYDFGISDSGDLYYVMELLDGVDLNTLVCEEGALPAARVAFLLDQACHALIEAHEAGLVHRDIKPANLVVGPRGPDADFLKVLDFGMVSIGADEGATALTAPGSMAGTPLTMSPECMRGEPVDARSDLYSLGCTAYWMLAGRNVFEGSMPSLLLAHASSEPEPLSRVVPRPVPADLSTLVHRCLAKDRDARPPSARALRDALRAIRFDEPWTEDQAHRWWSGRDARRRDQATAPPAEPRV